MDADLTGIGGSCHAENVPLKVRIPLRAGIPIKSRDVVVEVEKEYLKVGIPLYFKFEVGIRGRDPIIDGKLKATIKKETSTWVLEDRHTVVITLEKAVSSRFILVDRRHAVVEFSCGRRP